MKQERLKDYDSLPLVLDKSRLSIRLVPPYSEERRAAAKKYAEQHGFRPAQADQEIA